MSAEYTVGRKRPTDVSPTLAPQGSHVDSVRPKAPHVSATSPTPRDLAEPTEAPYGSFKAMLGRYPLLTAEQEVLLFQARERGQGVEDLRKEFQDEESPFRKSVAPKSLAAFERVLDESPTINHVVANCNLRLAASLAGRWKNDAVDIEDRTLAAYDGLLTAAATFDVERGYKFSTLATRWIFKAIQTEVYSSGRTIRLPAATEVAITRARRVAETFRETQGREPTNEEWIEAILSGTKMRAGIARDAVELLETKQTSITSLDVPLKDDSFETFGSFLPSPNDTERAAVTSVYNQTLYDAVSQLPEREREVLFLQFGFSEEGEMSQAAIAKQMGVSQQSVWKTRTQALNKLRQNGALQILREDGNEVEDAPQTVPTNTPEPNVLVFGAGAPGTKGPSEVSPVALTPGIVFVDNSEIETEYDDYGLAI